MKTKGVAVKVIEEGKWKTPWSTEMTCGQKQCGAKLLVEEADVKPVDYGSGFYAECAVCGDHLSVAATALPLRVQKALNKKRKYHSSWD